MIGRGRTECWRGPAAPSYNDVVPMTRASPVRRAAAALVLAAYAFVALLLLPLHLLESAEGPRGPGGPHPVLACGERDCHAPDHHHGERGHAHDPATCLQCGASAAPRTAAPVADAALPPPSPAAAAFRTAAPRPPVLPRALPPARGPPALS